MQDARVTAKYDESHRLHDGELLFCADRPMHFGSNRAIQLILRKKRSAGLEVWRRSNRNTFLTNLVRRGLLAFRSERVYNRGYEGACMPPDKDRQGMKLIPCRLRHVQTWLKQSKQSL